LQAVEPVEEVDEDELLEEEELDLLLEDDDVEELEVLLVEDELLDDAVGPTEHQAESAKALPPVNSD
jgi:hypothetical protein